MSFFTPMTPRELVSRLSDGTLLVRTGVALVPPQQMAAYEALALRWGAWAIDLVQRWLMQVPTGSRFLGLEAEALLRDLDAIATCVHERRCVLVANADVLVARLADSDRPRLWEFLFFSLKKRPTALLLLMPDGAEHLFSAAEVDRWSRAGRLCRLVDHVGEFSTLSYSGEV